MKKILLQKLQQTSLYTREEVHWLLQHIGDSNPSVRDDLVYISFGHALTNHLFTIKDFRWLTQEIIQQDLLFYQMGQAGEATLTRSFTTLLLAIILNMDNQEDSLYHQQLQEEELSFLFQRALDYLTTESDARGWDQDQGWVHAFAHGADLLLFANLHQKAPQTYAYDTWKAVLTVFTNQMTVFSAGEDERLANIFLSLLLEQKITETDWISWLADTSLPSEEPTDYLAYLNFQHFLSYLYLKLDQEGALSPALKEAIVRHIID